MTTVVHLVQVRFLENHKQVYTSMMLVKSREELVEKLSDKLNTFGIYSTELDETLCDLSSEDIVRIEYSSRYCSQCLLELQVLDKTDLP